MFDGLESARSREAGHCEQVVIALARPAKIARIELDFTSFINNNPSEISIDGLSGGAWVPLVARTSVKEFAGNTIHFRIACEGADARACEQVRLTLFPDGGINRVRVWC